MQQQGSNRILPEDHTIRIEMLLNLCTYELPWKWITYWKVEYVGVSLFSLGIYATYSRLPNLYEPNPQTKKNQSCRRNPICLIKAFVFRPNIESRGLCLIKTEKSWSGHLFCFLCVKIVCFDHCWIFTLERQILKFDHKTSLEM